MSTVLTSLVNRGFLCLGITWQSCRMSIFLHGAKPSSQILPEEKRVNRDHFGTKIDKGGTFGEQMLMFLSNYESLDRDISHRLCKSPPKKASFFKIVCSPKLLPQLANIFTRINPSYPWHFASLGLSNFLTRRHIPIGFLSSFREKLAIALTVQGEMRAISNIFSFLFFSPRRKERWNEDQDKEMMECCTSIIKRTKKSTSTQKAQTNIDISPTTRFSTNQSNYNLSCICCGALFFCSGVSLCYGTWNWSVKNLDSCKTKSSTPKGCKVQSSQARLEGRKPARS